MSVVTAATGHTLAQISLPDAISGLDHVIVVQQANKVDLTAHPALMRGDVVLHHDSATGLSASRNAGISLAKGDLLLFCDDDTVLYGDGLYQVRQAFASDPGLEVALAWRKEYAASRGKPLPERRLTIRNSGRACQPGMIVRRAALCKTGIRFDERFGVGAQYPIGEDYIFIADLLAAGVAGRDLPIIVGSHPGASSGDNWDDPVLMRARQAVLHRVFGRWRLLARMAYATKHLLRFGSPWHALSFVIGTHTFWGK